MPLTDSDIFKAQIYRNKNTDEDKKKFTAEWKELTQICKQGDLTIDDVFRYYTHILRARKEDKSKEVGLRKFYASDSYERLKDENLMSEITQLAKFWRLVNMEIEPDEENTYTLSTNAKKYLHCLKCYPNEYWKYATNVFFLRNKESETFEQDFELMLKKLISFLFAKFIDAPTVNAIKDDIYATCISLNQKKELQFKINFNENSLKNKIKELASSRLSRDLLLLEAYLNPAQKSKIPETFDIEHIFPKKWQNTNYNGWNKKDATEYLDKFGNKIVLEKKLNIQAGNGYFGVKKEKYSHSAIAIVKDLSNYPKEDWLKLDIEKREENFIANILNFFKDNIQLKVE
ncbi:HNH endonuclease family protein [Riemerella columbina]|uniref:HNH endonuclease family protein n=1 Tax=Riemerella columbina TaxID=103810 RepID=UPI00036E5698|nr:HNH endonuclease family protein [Riemerella columbina]